MRAITPSGYLATLQGWMSKTFYMCGVDAQASGHASARSSSHG